MNYTELSKEVSYALRHAPWEYELEMDEEGWVEVNQLIEALNRGNKASVQRTDLEDMINNSEKRRHEMVDDKIRALYGHSIPNRIKKEKLAPPNELYHGTSTIALKQIIEKGLLPMNRQYVHLSLDIDTAINVGKRHDDNPVILKIHSQKAWKNGIDFYRGNEKTWLADMIPFEYIEVIK